MFQVGLTCYLGLNSDRSVSINVNKTRKHFPETIMAPACSSNVPSFQYGKHCFQCQFFLRCKFCLRYTAGNFIENPSMRALAKFLRARASEHPSNYCEQFGQRPNFASAFKLDGTNYDGTIRRKVSGTSVTPKLQLCDASSRKTIP